MVNEKVLSIHSPQLLKDWDYKKNIGLSPDTITIGCSKKIHWICPKYNHSYESTIHDRIRGRGCSICAGKVILIGFNDLQTLFPALAKEWDTEKNKNLTPQMFTKGSKQKVFWICPNCKESYKAAICERTKQKPTGCPYCNKGVPIVGKTDLASLRPDIASQWDYEKNAPLTPQMFSIASRKIVNWKCPNCGYSWSASIYSRTKLNSGCPACSGRVVIKGKNDLASMRPDLLPEWDYSKNIDIKPDEISYMSHKKVNWLCPVYKHSYPARVYNRTAKKPTGCPYCSKRGVLKGFNDLATLRPEIAALWHPTKNRNLKPDMFSVYSNRSIWWLCKNGHKWRAQICDISAGSGCPICYKERNLKKE